MVVVGGGGGEIMAGCGWWGEIIFDCEKRRWDHGWSWVVEGDGGKIIAGRGWSHDLLMLIDKLAEGLRKDKCKVCLENVNVWANIQLCRLHDQLSTILTIATSNITVSIELDDTITDMVISKKPYPAVTELFIRETKQNISLVLNS